MAGNTMDALKKKMAAMRFEKEAASEKAERLEQQLLRQKSLNEQREDEIHNLQKQVLVLEDGLDQVHVELADVTNKLDTTEKQFFVQEAEIAALTRRIRLVVEDFEQTETRLDSASEKLQDTSKLAEDTERDRKALESRSLADDERITFLEARLKEAKYTAENADRNYEEAARKLAIAEVDLDRSETRLEAAETKIDELEDALKVVGSNMKSLEIAEQETSQREDSYDEIVHDLTVHLKESEYRAAEAERAVSKLQNEIDRLEDELLAEKEKYKTISEDLDDTFQELAAF